MTCSFPPWPILISPQFSRLHVQYVISYLSSPASLCYTVTAFICSRHFIAFCCICQRSVPQSNFPLSFKLSKNFLSCCVMFFLLLFLPCAPLGPLSVVLAFFIFVPLLCTALQSCIQSYVFSFPLLFRIFRIVSASCCYCVPFFMLSRLEHVSHVLKSFMSGWFPSGTWLPC